MFGRKRINEGNFMKAKDNTWLVCWFIAVVFGTIMVVAYKQERRQLNAPAATSCIWVPSHARMVCNNE